MRILRLFVLAFSFVFLLYSPVLVHDIESEIVDEAKNATEAVTIKKVEYELPYPGILPDSPLYFLKALRDRVIGSIISDPLKKAEYLLLTSDKRFYAGVFLVEKNKDELALSAISKGNNYFDEAISKLMEAKQQKKEINGLLNIMTVAGKKHVEVLSDLETKVDSSYKKGFKNEEKRALEMNEKLDALQPTPAVVEDFEVSLTEELSPTQSE